MFLLLLLFLPHAAQAGELMVFFYSWYGSAEHDSRWSHWDHSILPHWTPSIAAQFPGSDTRFIPPHDIHAPFFPAAGPYSSKNSTLLRAQLASLKACGVSAIVVSWWGRPGVSSGDSQGVLTGGAAALALDAAAAVGGIRVALHLEPYAGRTAESLAGDLAHIAAEFGSHPALHRDATGRPVYFVYDSYHLPPHEWRRLFTAGGDLSVRGTAADGTFLGLWLEAGHGKDLAEGGFEGGYTYFAADGFSYGSTTRNWGAMAAEAAALGLSFVPSVGPGYDDSKIRPWNSHNRRDREGGGYYKRMWKAALDATPAPSLVTVTSFNEWGEGTQIEPAVPRAIDVDALAPVGEALPHATREALRLRLWDRYEDYGEGGPELYMELTSGLRRSLRPPFRALTPNCESGAGASYLGLENKVLYYYICFLLKVHPPMASAPLLPACSPAAPPQARARALAAAASPPLRTTVVNPRGAARDAQ